MRSILLLTMEVYFYSYFIILCFGLINNEDDDHKDDYLVIFFIYFGCCLLFLSLPAASLSVIMLLLFQTCIIKKKVQKVSLTHVISFPHGHIFIFCRFLQLDDHTFCWRFYNSYHKSRETPPTLSSALYIHTLEGSHVLFPVFIFSPSGIS